jgi:TRAP-type C4-dicarboxylate transport system permease large subunit
MTFLFAGVAFRRGEMVTVEMLARAVPRPLRAAPVGFCLFIACGIGRVSLEAISRAVLSRGPLPIAVAA